MTNYVKLKDFVGSNSKGMSIASGENGQYQSFFKGIPIDVTEKQLAFINKFHKDSFDIVTEKEFEEHVVSHQRVEEVKEEVKKEESYTEAQAIAMVQSEQVALKSRGITKIPKKEADRVQAILDSNPKENN